jgi:hypothetical protein
MDRCGPRHEPCGPTRKTGVCSVITPHAARTLWCMVEAAEESLYILSDYTPTVRTPPKRSDHLD